MIVIMCSDYLFLSSASRIIASPPLKTAVAIHTNPANSFVRPKIFIIPFAAGIENTSNAASRLNRETPPRPCLKISRNQMKKSLAGESDYSDAN